MELIATGPEPVAYAYGAYLIDEGKRLRCGLLFVRKGNAQETLTLECPATQQQIRVRLPAQAVNPAGHARFRKETLEVL